LSNRRGENNNTQRDLLTLEAYSRQSAIDLKDTVSALQKERETNEEWYIIMPNNPWKGVWDSIMLVMLLWIAVILPLQLAFWEDGGEKSWVKIVDVFVDILFVIDMVLTCFMAKEGPDGTIIVDIRVLTKQYICSPMFAIDLIAVIPFETIMEGLEGVAGIKSLKLAKTFRFLRMLKALRLRNLSTKLKKLDHDPRCPTGCLRLAKIFTCLFIFAHFTGCVYFAVANDKRNKPEMTWLKYGGYDMQSLYTQYFMSVYWSLTTLTTVGFGDINAKNTTEVAVCMCTMLIGAISFSMITATISQLFVTTDEQAKDYRTKLTGAKAFLNNNPDIPDHIQEKMFQILADRWKLGMENLSNEDRVEDIYATLPPGFLKIVVYFVNMNLYKNSPILKELGRLPGGNEMLLELFIFLRRQDVSPKTEICIEGELLNKLYFIEVGEFVIFGTEDVHVQLDVMKSGECFGIISEMNDLHIHSFNVVSTDFGVLRYVNIEEFRKLDVWSSVFEKYAKLRHNRIKRKRKKYSRNRNVKTVDLSPHHHVEELLVDAWLSPLDIREKIINAPWFRKKEISESDIDEIRIIDFMQDMTKVEVEWTFHPKEDDVKRESLVNSLHRESSFYAIRRTEMLSHNSSGGTTASVTRRSTLRGSDASSGNFGVRRPTLNLTRRHTTSDVFNSNTAI